MATEIGVAYLSVLPSARGFGAALQAQTSAQIDAAGAEAGDRYATRFRDALEARAAGADPAKGVVASGGSEAGSEYGTSFKDALEARAAGAGDELDREVGAGSTRAGAEAGTKAGEAYRAALEEQVAHTDLAKKLEADAGGAGAAGDRAGRDFSNGFNNAANNSGGGGLGVLKAAIAGLSPALLGVGQVGAAVGLGLAGSFATAASGLGIFALAAKPVISSISTAATAQQTYTNAVRRPAPARRGRSRRSSP